MKINKDKQQLAQQKAKELLVEQERKRAESRLLKLSNELELGKTDVLLSDEFMSHLPDLIINYCETNDRDRLQDLVNKIGECACSEDVQVRERAVMALSLTLSRLDRKENRQLVQQISATLLRWLRVETVFLSACSTVCRQLQQEGTRFLEEGLWNECSALLDVFYKIQSGQLNKNNAIRSVIGKAQDGMAAPHILEELTLVSLRGRGERRAIAERTLLPLGRKAAIHLLNTLIVSKEKEDRLRLIGLIPGTGYVAVSVLKEYLKKPLPWYAVRNIVLMIAAMEDASLLSLVVPFFNHEDVRVQQQVLDCVFEVGSDKTGSYLLAALPEVNDKLKPILVEYLGRTCEPGSMDHFLDLLAQREDVDTHARDELLQTLAIQVRLSDSVRAINLLTQLVEEREEHFEMESDPVARAAIHSLHILQHRFGGEEAVTEPEEQSSAKSEEDVSYDGDPAALGKAKRKVQVINDEVAALLGDNKASEASQLLYEKCVEAAMVKDFDVAELLIDRILEVDPNAVAQLIRAGERIEEEKSSAVSSNHVTIWQDLYDSLTTEEFNGLYYSLQPKIYSTSAVIVEQGSVNPVLYFINSGQAKLTCQRDNEEIFLKRINPGEIVGGGPFFDVSVWTVSLTALGKVDLHVLERDTYLELLEDYPRLEHCLMEYCKSNESVPQLLKMSGEDRRQAARHPVSLFVQHALIDNGKVSKRSFKGEIADISTGGLSFYIRITRKENARLLLGRLLQTTINVTDNKNIICQGQIVAVRFQQNIERDYSVHVQFDHPLRDDEINSILGR